MSEGVNGRMEVLQQHLEAAYARDLPITLTHYAPPELIGRRAIRYSEVLTLLHAQQAWALAQQHSHQPALVPPGSVLTESQTSRSGASLHAGRCGYRNSEGVLAVASVAESAVDTRTEVPRQTHATVPGDEETLLQRVLPVAVGKVPLCSSDLHVQSYSAKDWRALEAVGVSVASLEAMSRHEGARSPSLLSGPASANSTAVATPSARTYAALVACEDRQEAQDVSMQYLLRGVAASSSPDNSADAASASHAIEEAAKAAGVDLAALPTFLFRRTIIDNPSAVNVDLFYGVREIPSDCPDYLDTLAEWARTLNEAEAGATSQLSLMNQTPAFLQHLLQSAKRRDQGTGSATAAIGDDVGGGAKDVAAVDSFTFHPVVKAKPEQVLDSVLPPRLLLFYDIHPEAVANEHARREGHDRRIRELLLEYYRDDGDGTSGKMQQLLADVREQHELKHAEDAVVGTSFLLVERVSRNQCPREGLLQLEQELETLLIESRARCWGTPIRLHPQSSNFLSTAQGMEAMAATMAHREARQTKAPLEARVLKPSPPPGPRHGASVKSHNNGNATTGTKSTTFFASTIHEGTMPTVSDPTKGGTATAVATLNMLELNRERTTLLLYLLRSELLRQVTLDSAECGILLSRLLAEADLSLNAREVVLRESLSHSQVTLDRGQDCREALTEQAAALEKEVAALKTRLTSVQVRKQSIERWVDERKAFEKSKAAQTTNFQDLLLERLKKHTEEVSTMQDRDRRGSVDTTA